MKKNFAKGLLKFLFAVAVVAIVFYFGKEAAMPTKTLNEDEEEEVISTTSSIGKEGVKLGLDLAGGVSITYQTVIDNPTQEQMDDAIYKLQLKAQDYSTEAEVYQESNNKINIDIPGATDANEILEQLGKPGTLYFVEGEVSYPLKSTASNASIASGSNAGIASGSSVSSSNNDDLKNIFGGNVNIDGADVVKNDDGSITIGGSGGTSISGSSNGEVSQTDPNNPDDIYDYDGDLQYDESQIVVSGEDITEAKGAMYQDNYGKTSYVVDLAFTEEGKKKFADATKRNMGKIIYILYNGKVASMPTVQSEINDGRAQITGMESLEQANLLASTIRIGALPVELKEIRSNVVGAKLGEEAITTSVKAGAIGLIIVCIFMMVVYLIPGFAASIALCLYVGLMLYLLKNYNITLTLPGIAGIILGIGMAVDANVIIFTRIKEEIGIGRSVKVAVKEGYHKALSAIIDGNVTTLIAAAVLFIKGSGSIKGFSITLALGIVLSLFTALFVTTFIINAFVSMGITNPKLYGVKKEKKPFNFTGFRKISYTISILVIVVGIVFMVKNKITTNDMFNFGLDFKGGSSTSIMFNENLTRSEIDSKIVPIFENVTKDPSTQFQKSQESNEVIIKTRDLTLDERKEITKNLIDQYHIEEKDINIENISGAVSSQMRSDAIVAVIISTILMLIYIWFRFNDIRFASAAVIALLHDVLVTVGFYAIFRWTVDSTFIACMLTIVGYSINATIVIFDRIRENLKSMNNSDLKSIVNVSITQTFTRSMNTSLTTFVMVLTLFIIGVSSIRLFALPLMIGILAGTFSSVCITGGLWYDMKRKQKKEDVIDTPHIKVEEKKEEKEKLEDNKNQNDNPNKIQKKKYEPKKDRILHQTPKRKNRW